MRYSPCRVIVFSIVAFFIFIFFKNKNPLNSQPLRRDVWSRAEAQYLVTHFPYDMKAEDPWTYVRALTNGSIVGKPHYRNLSFTIGTVLAQVYRAEYDPTIDPSVVIIHFYSRYVRLRANKQPAICHILDEHKRPLERPAVIPNPLYYILHCPIRNPSLRPSFVNVNILRDTASTAVLPVHIRYPTRSPPQGLSICGGHIYGSPDWLLLLQFFEHYKLQQATQIYLCRMGINSTTQAILDHYARSGFLKIIEFPATEDCVPEMPPKNNYNNCHLTCVNLCVSEARADGFKYMANVDTDELLHVENSTLVDLLQMVDKNSTGSFTFSMRMFSRTEGSAPITSVLLANKTMFFNEIPAIKYRYATEAGPSRFLSKVIIKLQTVKSLHIHKVKKFWPGPKYIKVALDAKLAYVRHYRHHGHKEMHLLWQLKHYQISNMAQNASFTQEYSEKLAWNVYEVARQLLNILLEGAVMWD